MVFLVNNVVRAMKLAERHPKSSLFFDGDGQIYGPQEIETQLWTIV